MLDLLSLQRLLIIPAVNTKPLTLIYKDLLSSPTSSSALFPFPFSSPVGFLSDS